MLYSFKFSSYLNLGFLILILISCLESQACGAAQTKSVRTKKTHSCGCKKVKQKFALHSQTRSPSSETGFIVQLAKLGYQPVSEVNTIPPFRANATRDLGSSTLSSQAELNSFAYASSFPRSYLANPITETLAPIFRFNTPFK